MPESAIRAKGASWGVILTALSQKLRSLEQNPNLFIEIVFGGQLPIRLKFDGLLELVNQHSYVFKAEASGVQIFIDADSEAWNINDDGVGITVSKEAGQLRTYIRIGSRTHG